MMNVVPPDHDPLEWPTVMNNQAHQDAHTHERNQKREGREEHAPPRAVGNGGADEKSKPRELKRDQKRGRHQHDKGK